MTMEADSSVLVDGTLKLEVATGVDQGPWDSLLESLGGTLYHSSTWAAYACADQGGLAPLFFTLAPRGNGIRGAALGFLQRSRNRLLGPLTAHLGFDAIPVVHRSLLADFIRVITSFAQRRRFAAVSFGSYASEGCAAELRSSGFDVVKRLEFELDLERPESELWGEVESRRRTKIRKAMRMGVTTHELSGLEGIAVLRVLRSQAAERIVARGGPDISSSWQTERDPVGILLRSGVGRIMAAKSNGEFVSAGLFTHFNGVVYAHLSGHNLKALEAQAPSLLFWETIIRYKSEGARVFNFGGCPMDAMNENSPEHGVFVHKKAWGARIVECTSGEKIIRRGVIRTTTALKSLLRRFARRGG